MGFQSGLTAYVWTAAGKSEALEVNYAEPISQRLHWAVHLSDRIIEGNLCGWRKCRPCYLEQEAKKG